MSDLLRIGSKPAIAVEVCGAGELVFFLHGIGGNRRSWRGQLPAVATEFRAAAWDARGYGASDDFDEPLRFPDFANDLLRVLDALGEEQAHLVGLSMGGRIALDFYRRHPGRVRSLTLADTSAGHPNATDPAAIEAALNLRRKPLLDGKTLDELAPELARAMAGPDISEAAFAELVDNLTALRKEPYLKILECVTRYDDFPDYASILAPTLIINGDADVIAKPEVAARMALRIPDHRFVLLERTGHVSNIENPQAFNAALLGFLREQRGDALATGRRRGA